jgi:Rieske 2Fe-2S family protein
LEAFVGVKPAFPNIHEVGWFSQGAAETGLTLGCRPGNFTAPMAAPTPSPGNTLARRYFVDANVFDEETEKIFRARWLFVERASVVENAGDFVSTDLEGEGLIVVRDCEEVLRMFYNVCRHRGTRLCNEPKGNRARGFTCPYHAWRYGLDGSLKGAPHMDETAGFNKADFPLNPPAHATWEVGVFVHLSDAPEPFEQACAPVLTKFAPWHLGELRPVHREVYEVAANWKLIVQNYSECYHCPIIHPALEKLSHYRDTENDLDEGPFLGGLMRIGEEGGGLSRDGRRSAVLLPGVEGANLQRAYYYSLFPTLLLSLQTDFVPCPTCSAWHPITRASSANGFIIRRLLLEMALTRSRRLTCGTK